MTYQNKPHTFNNCPIINKMDGGMVHVCPAMEHEDCKERYLVAEWQTINSCHPLLIGEVSWCAPR